MLFGNTHENRAAALLIGAFAAVLFMTGVASVAVADNANCRDYTLAKGHRRSLLNEYIYDNVMAKVGNRSGYDVNTIATKVIELTDTYCPEHPYESLVTAISTFTTDALHPRRGK